MKTKCPHCGQQFEIPGGLKHERRKAILASMNGAMTLRQIAEATQIPITPVRHIVLGLVQEGLVRLMPGGIAAAYYHKCDPT